MVARVLSVGQCGIDGPRITRCLHSRLNAVVDTAGTLAEAARRLAASQYDLVLVNRVLAADGSSGVELIDELVESGCPAPIMLVSDHDDAQRDAVARGALRGFGKADLEDDETTELIRRVCEGQSPDPTR